MYVQYKIINLLIYEKTRLRFKNYTYYILERRKKEREREREKSVYVCNINLLILKKYMNIFL